MFGMMMEYPLLISSLIEHAARFHGDTEIVSREADRSLHRYTFAAAYDRARQVAKALLKLGIQPGDRPSRPWPGTRIGISSSITASPASAP